MIDNFIVKIIFSYFTNSKEYRLICHNWNDILIQQRQNSWITVPDMKKITIEKGTKTYNRNRYYYVKYNDEKIIFETPMLTAPFGTNGAYNPAKLCLSLDNPQALILKNMIEKIEHSVAVEINKHLVTRSGRNFMFLNTDNNYNKSIRYSSAIDPDIPDRYPPYWQVKFDYQSNQLLTKMVDSEGNPLKLNEIYPKNKCQCITELKDVLVIGERLIIINWILKEIIVKK